METRSLRNQVNRRTHTKSRRGCLQCKKRHVKCNESRPQCGRCERLDIDCTWPLKKQVDVSSEDNALSCPATGSKEGVNGREVGVRSLGMGSDWMDVADMRLLHFWYLNTSLTCAHTGQQYIWQTSLIDLAFDHHFLLHGILATAAIHKATIHPDKSAHLLLQSTKHMDIALTTFKSHLERPDPATCVPVFALACLLVLHRLGLAQIHPPTDPIEELCVYARLSRGIKPTVEKYWPRILMSELSPLVRNVTEPSIPHPTSLSVTLLEWEDIVSQAHQLLLALQPSYLLAISELKTTFSSTPSGATDPASVARIFNWLAVLSDDVLGALGEREEVAMGILVLWAELLEGGEGVWYLRGWKGAVLGAVQGGLDGS